MTGDADCVGGCQILHAGGIQRQHLHIYALIVHGGDATFVDLTQPLGDRVVAEARGHLIQFVLR